MVKYFVPCPQCSIENRLTGDSSSFSVLARCLSKYTVKCRCGEVFKMSNGTRLKSVWYYVDGEVIHPFRF